MVLQECTSSVGISKTKSTTQESWRAKGLEGATCVVGFDGAASSTLVSSSLLIVSSCVSLVLADS